MMKEYQNAEYDLKKAKSVLKMDELKCRKRVLRRLGYATAQDVIERKGRVACELSAADELLITEMLFNGLFNDISGMCSTFVITRFHSLLSVFFHESFAALFAYLL